MRSNNVFIENTKFIYETNFAGDPERDRFGSAERKGNIIIPDVAMARQLIDEGFNVKMTKPADVNRFNESTTLKTEFGSYENYCANFVPSYYVVIKLSYRDRNNVPKQWPPKVFLYTEGACNELDEETANLIDTAWIENVNVVLNKYESMRGKSLYIKTMECYQHVEYDPIMARHSRRGGVMNDEEDNVNFHPENEEEMPFV